MKDNLPLVSICCITYNHVPYIRQCLDGFMMQHTNFDFEVLIHDDASTDGTTEIIKEYEAKYPDIIKPLYEDENQWVKGRRGSAVFNFPRAKGKYIALCEGDDYWTDPLKLQKQVDFLQANPEYVLCCHSFNEINNDNSHTWLPPQFDDIITLDKFIKGECAIRTMTVMFCASTLKLTKYMQYKYKVDLALYFSMLSNGLGYYMRDNMAVYRKHDNGVWTSLNTISKWGMSFNIKYDLLKCENNFQSAQYMYHFLLQGESRKVQMQYFDKILVSLYIIGTHLGLRKVMKIIKFILFRSQSNE